MTNWLSLLLLFLILDELHLKLLSVAWAVVVAQLDEWSLSTPDVRGSNPVSGKNFYWTLYWKDENKKRPEMVHLINFSLSRWKLEEDWRYLNNQDEEGPWLGHSWQSQRTLLYFVKGSITVRLTSCLTGLDSTKQFDVFLIRHKQSTCIQTQNKVWEFSPAEWLLLAPGKHWFESSQQQLINCQMMRNKYSQF